MIFNMVLAPLASKGTKREFERGPCATCIAILFRGLVVLGDDEERHLGAPAPVEFLGLSM
jgi:hypothetical protein